MSLKSQCSSDLAQGGEYEVTRDDRAHYSVVILGELFAKITLLKVALFSTNVGGLKIHLLSFVGDEVSKNNK